MSTNVNKTLQYKSNLVKIRLVAIEFLLETRLTDDKCHRLNVVLMVYLLRFVICSVTHLGQKDLNA
jgi:hypothetical protein